MQVIFLDINKVYKGFNSILTISLEVPNLIRGPQHPEPDETYKLESLVVYKPYLYLN